MEPAFIPSISISSQSSSIHGPMCSHHHHTKKITSKQAIVCNAAGPSDSSFSSNDGMDDIRKQLERSLSTVVTQTTNEQGDTDCIWCTGSGKCVCPWCKGIGYRYEINIKSQQNWKDDIDKLLRGESVELPPKEPVPCSACRGTTHLRCRYCKGMGKGTYGFTQYP
eukprot:CAMPEP_0184707280 /NCGR_PEP_ID=MMETSP0313-20130426/37190_1 /TAXON_ID=2792 /ORGANISM="Porphyridium aerugineum, Strain SAG 1380-2" /LENGTH=165 /DNA_ID=CAMNT_0027168855 /DNA_START=62 /DNA_END=559 /DNA_ORIENTATION=+